MTAEWINSPPPKISAADVATWLRLDWLATSPHLRTQATWDGLVASVRRTFGDDLVRDALLVVASRDLDLAPQQMAAVVGNAQAVERDLAENLRPPEFMRIIRPGGEPELVPAGIEAEAPLVPRRSGAQAEAVMSTAHQEAVLETYRSTLEEIAANDWVHAPHDPGDYRPNPGKRGRFGKMALRALGRAED